LVLISLGSAVRRNDNEEIAKTINMAEEVMYTQKMLDIRSYRSAILECSGEPYLEKP
jgi:hypothetical protein